MKLKFGFCMPTFGSFVTRPNAAEDYRVIAQYAESLGYDSLWVSDHIILPATMEAATYPYTESGEFPFPLNIPFHEPLTFLAFLAGVTTRIRLGTSILVLPYRNPIFTAKIIATIDVLGGGRVILGAGAGYLAEEFAILGANFKERGAQTDEYVRIMRELWSSHDPAFDGKFFSFRNVKFEPKPAQSHLPIWFGGHSRRMIKRAAESGDGCIFPPSNSEQFRVQNGLLIEEAAKANRDIRSITKAVGISGSVPICVTEIDRFEKLGIDYFMINLTDPKSNGEYTSLQEYLSAISELAEKLGIKPALL
jgi:probable F420-dependent oxidoreductase